MIKHNFPNHFNFIFEIVRNKSKPNIRSFTPQIFSNLYHIKLYKCPIHNQVMNNQKYI